MRPAAAAFALAVALAAGAAVAQTYPSKPIRMVVPFPAGGTSDIIGRTLGHKLNEAWGQPVIVDNRAGVAGSIGVAITAKAPADGYTLVVGNVGPVAVNPMMYKAVGYDSVKDLTPITLTVTAPQLVVVHPGVPAKTFEEFNALVKKHEGKIKFGTSGPGSISHLSAELYKRMTKTDMLHVPYKGSALITTAVIGGEVDVVFSDMAVVLPHVKGGKLRALAVTSAKPTPLVPGVPSMAEAGVPGFDVTSWWGILGPAGVPRPIVAQLNKELGRILQLEDVRKTFATLGVDATSSTPGEFANLIKTEVARYAKLLSDIGLERQ
jgi:tripartite-type tricarboxylate transporter receptor subunit TctC